MLDQSFSSQNFNNIFLRENRKGTFKKEYFSEQYLQKHEQFKQALAEKIDLKFKQGTLSTDELDFFQKKLENINKEKEIIRAESFQEVSDEIHDKNFSYGLMYTAKNETFSVDENLATFLAIKQLQFNVFKTFGVKQSNRNHIVKQLYSIISDGFPKILVRADIKSFYESIPQSMLFPKLESNTLLSPISKKLIKKLFFEYENKKDTSKILPGFGIPRGVGLSPLLAELYLKDLDHEMESLKDVMYYQRYVDDIIVVFSPKTESSKRDYLSEVKQLIIQNGLTASPSKTFKVELLSNNTCKQDFTYLGYKFITEQTTNKFTSTIEISDKKVLKYGERIIKTIEEYNATSKFNEPRARDLLILRLKFITGNYHLNNSKKNIKTGIYYSNEMLRLNRNTYRSLRDLDSILLAQLYRLNPPSKIGINRNNLVTSLKLRFNFQRSFNNKQKSFYSFNLKPKQAKYFRKFGHSTSVFEIIKSIWK